MQIAPYITRLAWAAALLSVIMLCMGVYGEMLFFSIFVHDFSSFVKDVVPSWPYYFFPIWVIYFTIKKKYCYFFALLIFLPFVIKNQFYYLVAVYSNPRIITLWYTKLLAIVTCLMVVLALASGLLSIINLKDK